MDDVPDDQGLTEQLVARIKAGDQDAWNDLYGRYRDRLLVAIRSRLGVRIRERMESEDVLQSVVRDALVELDRFEWRGGGSLQRFLNVMINHKIGNQARKIQAQKRAGEVPLKESAMAPAGGQLSYTNRPLYERLERCLQQLPPEMREVVLLRKVEGLSSKDAAEAMGKSDAAVRKLYSRAVAQLQELMIKDGR